tara:strand:- start:344 stop:1237 length:894 start_codon:yes stop_codon:yes gene_type:complete
MATINLGRIKPVNKGTWSNSTAYAVDDFVQYTDNGVLSTYIAVATSTNQTPSTSGTVNSTYWKFMAKGVADSLSGLGNNKIVTTDGSGNVQAVSIGTAGQSLKVNSGANGFEFGTVSSDLVKLAHADITTQASYMESSGWVDDSTYSCYLIRVNNLRYDTGSGDVNFRFAISGGQDNTNNYMAMDGMYYSAGSQGYQRRAYWNDGAINDFEGTWSNKHTSATDGRTDTFNATLYSPASGYAKMIYQYGTWHSHSSNTFNIVQGYYAKYNSNAVTGFRIYKSGANTRTATISVYGMKK